MSVQEMIVALVGTIAGVGLVGYLAGKIFGLIRAWINRNSNSIPEEQFDRLAQAFIKYKKDTERRLQHLEAIVAEDEGSSTERSQSGSKEIEAPKQEIEIEDREPEEGQSQSGEDNNLRNMLRE